MNHFFLLFLINMLRRVEERLGEALSEGVFPGASLLVARGEEILHDQSAGFARIVPDKERLTPDHLFDLASLTKVIATTTAVMLLTNKGEISLGDRASRYLKGFSRGGKKDIGIRHLLCHSAGLPSWRPYYQEFSQEKEGSRVGPGEEGKRYVYQRVKEERLADKVAQSSLYGDLDFILLGEIIELVSGATLSNFCRENIFLPLGLKQTTFIEAPESPVRERFNFVATEDCPWRKRILCGEVHDENAFLMGGAAGHAGLFATARDLFKFISVLLRSLKGEEDFLPAPLIREFFTRQDLPSGSTWALGWDTPSPRGSTSGRYFSPHSIGHCGFTGTSIWIELEKELVVILLSNRVHPRRDNQKISGFRPTIHDLIFEELFSTEDKKNKVSLDRREKRE